MDFHQHMNDICITGLAGTEAANRYLESAYGLVHVEDVEGVPVYQSNEGEFFVGGYKHVYSIIVSGEDRVLSSLESWRKAHASVRYSFVTKQDMFKSNRLNLVLELPIGMEIDSRLETYARNVRKHIRRVEESLLEYRIGKPPVEWYELHVAHCNRLNSTPRPLKWFQSLEDAGGGMVVCVTAYDEKKPVGGLYCLRGESCLHLAFIASDIAYRNVRVDNGLYDMAVQYAIREGIRFVDFGPTMRTDVSHWDMKAGYGAQVFYFADKTFIPSIKRLDEQSRHLVYRIKRRVKTIWNRFMTHIKQP